MVDTIEAPPPEPFGCVGVVPTSDCDGAPLPPLQPATTTASNAATNGILMSLASPMRSSRT